MVVVVVIVVVVVVVVVVVAAYCMPVKCCEPSKYALIPNPDTSYIHFLYTMFTGSKHYLFLLT